MKTNKTQVAQVIAAETKVNHKTSGRNNANTQVSNSVLVESGDNTDLINAEKVVGDSAENQSENKSEKNVDVFRSAVTDSFEELISNDEEFLRLSAALEARRRSLLVDALESNIPSLYADVEGVTAADVDVLISFGRDFTNGWVCDCCTRVDEGVKTYQSYVGETRSAFSVAVDSDKFYPTTIVGRFRSFIEVARVAGLPCYAPFAAYDKKVKTEKAATAAVAAMDDEILARALAARLGCSFDDAKALLNK